MEKWKQEILDAFAKGKTIQSNHILDKWCDFVPHNQVDSPNVDYGTKDNWRVKPDDDEREEILKKSGAYGIPNNMKEELETTSEKKYTKEHMLLFGGFCAGKFRQNPSLTGDQLWAEWEEIFKE